ASSADVHDEAPLVVRPEPVSDARIDQPRLFDAADDFDGVPERRFGLLEKLPSIAGDAKRVRAHDANAPLRQRADALTEALQAFEGALLNVLRQTPRRIQPGAELHHFF